MSDFRSESRANLERASHFYLSRYPRAGSLGSCPVGDETRRDERRNIQIPGNPLGTRRSARDAPRMQRRRDAVRRDATRRASSGCSLSVSAKKTGGEGRGGTLSPVKLRNIPREILQFVRRAEVRASCRNAARQTPRRVVNNEDR